MKQIIIVMLMAQAVVSNISHGAAPIPVEFHGDWTTSVVKIEGFPWWLQVKYPVRLTITGAGVTIKDQADVVCQATVAFYDEEISALVIRYCGSTKSANAFPPYYKLEVCQGRICGKVWTYKELFEFVGNRVEVKD